MEEKKREEVMNKSTRNLLIVFVVLVIIVYLFFRGKDVQRTENVEEKFFKVDSAKIEKIEIVKKDETITLEKVGGNWMVTKPVNYPADTTAISQMLSNLQNYKIESIISSNPEKASNYMDSLSNPQIVVYQEGKQAGSLILGKQASGGNDSYVKKTPDSKEIYLASKLNGSNFTKPLREFRNKQIFSIQGFTVNKITFKSDDSLKYEFTMVKDTTGKWWIGQDSVPSNNAMGFTNLLANFNTEDFKDTVITQFPPPSYTITITGNQNTVINLYKEKTETVKYIMQVSGKNQLFECSASFATMFIKQKKDFIPEKTPEKKEEPKKKK
jgi:uncharacterized protein DUF4340/MFS transporter